MEENRSKKVTCSKCGLTFVPSFNFDFYPDGSDNPDSGWCETCMMKQAFPKQPFGDPHPIPKDYEKDVCRIGRGKDTCAFLSVSKRWMCMKGSAMETEIRKMVQEKSISAQADNCAGYPDFKTY